mmetsp:Transcript_1152/g.1285  ORF Transcript_1152/g.1285 Transcript_1152/m.1285 type:complete len:94 (+) Transcript_1152:101-382(+)
MMIRKLKIELDFFSLMIMKLLLFDSITRVSSNSFHDFITGSWNTEHTKVVLKCGNVGRQTGSSRAIFQSVHFVSLLIGGTHGTLDTTICQKST